MEGLVQWLKSQHKGLRTYKAFHQRVLELGGQHRDEFALYFLLSAVAARFVDAFEDSPLTLDVTDEAHKRLVAITEKASQYPRMPAEQRLALLNEIAVTDLA